MVVVHSHLQLQDTIQHHHLHHHQALQDAAAPKSPTKRLSALKWLLCVAFGINSSTSSSTMGLQDC